MNLVGQRLGKYQLSERLGQGGMAQVYKAHQPTIDRFVAIKVMHSHLSESDDFIERFKREARGLGQLRHPHIVNIIDFDAEDEYYYMVMDYIAGPTLSDLLQQQGAFSLEMSLRVTRQLCDALDYAHERGTIHRDLKPANVMFVDDSLQQPVLTDFGIARLLDETALTASGALSGTPAYISPEAIKGARVDGRADLYSLGIILYEMITGQPPYSGDTSWSVMMQHVNEPPPRLDQVKPDTPLFVTNLIERAMAKPVAERFQSAAEFRQAILEAEYALQPGTGTATDISYSPLPTTLSPIPAPSDRETLPATVRETALPPSTTLPSQPPAAEGGPTSVTNPAKRPFAWLLGGALALLLMAVGVALIWRSGWVDTALPVLQPPTAAQTGQFGLVRFQDTEDGHQLSLHLERAAQPLPDHHYAWWIRADDQRVFYLGRLPYENGRIQATVHLEDNLLLNFAAALITLEANDQPVTSPSGQIVFQGELDAGYVAHINQLFVASEETTGKAYLPAASEQLGLAGQHYEFLQQSLAANDLPEAQRHAEHVVNILEGEEGEFFGDVDRSGQVENPGDGLGARHYVSQAAARIETAAASLTATPLRQAQAEAAMATAAQVLALSDALTQEALRVAASDSVAEAQTPSEQMGIHVADLLAAERLSHSPHDDLPALTPHQGLMVTAVNQILALSDVLLLPTAAHPDLPAPDPLAAPDERLGFFYPQPDNRFLLLLDQVPPLPADAHYALWAHDPGSDRFDLLATFTTTNGLIHLSGQSNGVLLGEYGRIAVSREAATATDLSRPGEAIHMAGSFDPALVELVRTLTTATSFQEKGALFGAAEQTELAAQHAGFMRQSLADNDLVEARRHAEHVVNILDGDGGEFFGDVDRDGQVENPGDGMGVRTYLEQVIEQMETVVEQFDLSGNQHFYAALASQNAENGLLLTDAAVREALRLIAADTVEEANPIAEATARHLTHLVDGFDDENDGLADPLLGEGGLNAAARFAFKLAEVTLIPVLP
jgi:serine/threonine protein kinase